MKKFEVGKRYVEGGVTFEVISRTAKTAKWHLYNTSEDATKK